MTEREIWRAAIVLVRNYGSQAPARAEQNALKFCERDDPEGWAPWAWIEKVAGELLRVKPQRGVGRGRAAPS